MGREVAESKVKLAKGEGQLENYGKENFAKLFGYVCSLEHVEPLASDENYDELLFDSAFGNTVHHKIKQALRKALWKDDGQYLQCWFGLPEALCRNWNLWRKMHLNLATDSQLHLKLMDSNLLPIYMRLKSIAVFTPMNTFLTPLASKAALQSTLLWQREELKPWWNRTIVS